MDLGYRQRDKRAIASFDARSSTPTATIFATSSGWSETISACRLFNNEHGICEDGPGKLCIKKWFMGIYRNRSSHSLKLSKDHINNLLFVRPER